MLSVGGSDETSRAELQRARQEIAEQLRSLEYSPIMGGWSVQKQQLRSRLLKMLDELDALLENS